MTRFAHLATLSLLLGGLVAEAAPRRDISQLDLESAKQTVTATGLEIRTLWGLSPDNGVGILIGGRLVRYLSDAFFLGGGGYGGSLVGRPGQTGGFGYGGFIAGAELKASDALSFSAMVLLGGGGGTPAPGDQAAGFIAEPGVAIDWAITKGTRLGLTGGYLFLIGSRSLSGFVIGLRLEAKSFNLSFPE